MRRSPRGPPRRRVGSTAPSSRRIAAGLVLGALALVAAAPAQAQLPPPPGTGEHHYTIVSVEVDTLPQEVPLLGQAVYDVRVEDRSVDRFPDGPGVLHTIFLDLEYLDPANSTGWSAFLGPKFFQGVAGDSFPTTATVTVGPTVQSQVFRFLLRATLHSSGGGPPVTDEQEVVAKLRPFSLATVDLPGAVPTVAPFGDVSIPVVVGNAGQYPDAFLLTAQGPEGWFISVQPRITLQPGEERTIQVQATAPALRVFTPQETAVILIQVRSERDPGVVYERASVVVLEGMFLPEYWAPVVAAGIVAAGLAGRQAVEGARRRGLEQGRPVPLRLTPAQRLVLADLKRRDPERYQAIVQRQKTAMRARERAFLAVRGRRAQLERALVDRQHRQVREAKAAERAAEREDEERARALARQKALLLQEKERRERALARKQAAEEARRKRLEERRARLAAPSERKAAAERRARERKLRAQLARRQRELAVVERKRRAELEKKRRLLERRRREAEKRARRAAKREGRPPRPGAPGGGGLFGRGKKRAGDREGGDGGGAGDGAGDGAGGGGA